MAKTTTGDTTDLTRIEDALRRQREEQQIILDSMPAMVWYKDCENRILRANRAAAESMGAKASDLEGRSTYDIYPDEAAQYHRDDLEVIRSGVPKLNIVEPLQTASGEKRWVRTDKIPYRDESGEVVGVIVFAIDITERKRAEQALEQARDQLEQRVQERTAQLAAAVDSLRAEIAERERAEEQSRQHQSQLAHVLRLQAIEGMAAELAHEINQPLGAIANFASGLAARLRGGAIQTDAMLDAAEQISKQALRAGQVIRRLRDFARKEEPERRPCDVNHVVRDAAHLIEPDARRHEVAVRLCLDRHLPLVHADRTQVEQVILNLLRNGLESIVENGAERDELLIESAAGADGGVEVKVRDTGAGLRPEAAERLFEPFFSTKQDGLGMGLCISRSIIDAHGGRIWASANGDRGATFGFSLPAPTPETS